MLVGIWGILETMDVRRDVCCSIIVSYNVVCGGIEGILAIVNAIGEDRIIIGHAAIHISTIG